MGQERGDNKVKASFFASAVKGAMAMRPVSPVHIDIGIGPEDIHDLDKSPSSAALQRLSSMIVISSRHTGRRQEYSISSTERKTEKNNDNNNTYDILSQRLD